MKIKGFQCKNLAGIAGKEINFIDGLNVVVGANEAGKSTLMEGMFGTLFRNHRLKNNNNADKEFARRFRPYPNGDSMIGQLSFEVEGMHCKISKEWGKAPSVALNLNGQVIKDDKAIGEHLSPLLKYGENTYGNIVFAKQKDVKEALERISRDEETQNIVGNLLRKGIMALDGVSLEKLRKKIEDEISTLNRRWDIVNNRPEGNKGYENRWKSGVGIVLESFYKKEALWRDMNFAKKIENEYASAVRNLKEIENKKLGIKGEINRYAKIEKDIVQRATIEPKLSVLHDKDKELKTINKVYPVNEKELKEGKEKLEKLQKEMAALEKEQKIAQRIKEAENSKSLLLKIETIENQIKEIFKEKTKYTAIEDGDIRKIEKAKHSMDTAKISMEAGTILGKLNKSKNQIYITRGVEEREEITEGTDFSASGYLKIEVGTDIELEIKAGEINFEELKEQYDKAKSEYETYLKKFKVADLEEAKVQNKMYNKLDSDAKEKEKQIKVLIGENNLEELKLSVKETDKLQARTVEEITKLITELNEKITDLKAKNKTLENIINGWAEKYGTQDDIVNLMVTSLNDINNVEKELKGLAELPVEFNSSKEFQEHITNKRSEQDSLNDQEKTLKETYYDIQNKLPDLTFEELEPMYKEAEVKFQRQLARLNHLVKIRAVFNQKIADMDKGSFEPLTQTFNKYLEKITDGKYESGIINDGLISNLVKDGNKELPIDLLSSGTYDSVLLTLRFTIIEYLFGGKNGLVVLDDCLVNMDPDRKLKAVELIKEFAKNNQVIFTTCDPITANILGGNVINL